VTLTYELDLETAPRWTTATYI